MLSWRLRAGRFVGSVTRRRGGPPAHRPSGRGPGCGFASDHAIPTPNPAVGGFVCIRQREIRDLRHVNSAERKFLPKKLISAAAGVVGGFIAQPTIITNPPSRILHRAPVGQGPSGPDWLAIAFGFWLQVLVWTGACYWHGVGGFMFNSVGLGPCAQKHASWLARGDKPSQQLPTPHKREERDVGQGDYVCDSWSNGLCRGRRGSPGGCP